MTFKERATAVRNYRVCFARTSTSCTLKARYDGALVCVECTAFDFPSLMTPDHVNDQRNFTIATRATECSLEIVIFNDGFDGLPLLMELSTDLVPDDLLAWHFLANDTDNFITNSNAVSSRLCTSIWFIRRL